MNTVVEPVVAVVVAAGSGSRLGAEVPKALVDLGGESLVGHAVRAMVAGGALRVVVTVPAGHLADFEAVLAGRTEVRLVVGGAERQDSVRLGLAALAEEFGPETVVLVHDAARPLVPQRVVRDVVTAVRDGADAVVPVVDVHDSIRTAEPVGSQPVDRSTLRAVQTPQGARLAVLRQAHRLVQERGLPVTDDASAVELLGRAVTQVAGDREAAKITEPADLLLAEAVLDRRRKT
ncbi:MAG: 2-C-methyl-D-erythritol 4-phosphate cytidylyltransferase [Arachnia propionica]|uniref:2-C-methyl-D-erythritol 4-phosphate cytidylyltransferase n=1 Tax=Arachnia propionica TaxID=1750 RepID=UPI002708FFA6|nr:2-C-methyl-D-erythritol 4-phosphate cytidylyltransferase [Arachnia propionica]